MSGPFSFRLQALLDHKAALESGARRDVAEAANACDATRRRVAALYAELQGYDAVPNLRLRYLRADYVQRKLNTEESVLRGRQAVFEQAKARLRRAAQEKNALERLKQRRVAHHAAAMARVEEEELEEINARRAVAR